MRALGHLPAPPGAGLIPPGSAWSQHSQGDDLTLTWVTDQPEPVGCPQAQLEVQQPASDPQGFTEHLLYVSTCVRTREWPRGSRLSGQGREGVNKGFYKAIRAAFQDMRERLGEGERKTERERETQTLGVKGELRDEKAMRPSGADGDSPTPGHCGSTTDSCWALLGPGAPGQPFTFWAVATPRQAQVKISLQPRSPDLTGSRFLLGPHSVPGGSGPPLQCLPQQPLQPAQQRSTRP